MLAGRFRGGLRIGVSLAMLTLLVSGDALPGESLATKHSP